MGGKTFDFPEKVLHFSQQFFLVQGI